MVFTSLCRGNQVMTYNLVLHNKWIFNDNNIQAIVNNKISRYLYFQNIAIISLKQYRLAQKL